MRSRFFAPRFAAFVLLALFAQASAQVSGTALVRHAPAVNGTIDGSVQQMLPESVTLNGGAVVTGDLRVPGLPTVRLNGAPNYDGTLDGTGAATPNDYQVTLNGNSRLKHVVRRTNAVAIPAVAAPPQPTGTRTVTINSAGESAGNFATLRHLTLNGNVGQYAIPPGTYGDFTANGGSGLTLGVAGATQPSVYNFQRLTLNGQTQVQVLGPVVITVANGFTANGTLGSSTHPSRLTLNVYSGGFTLNGGCNVYGYVNAPSGTVVVNGNSQLIGGVTCDRLTVNGGGLLRLFVAQPTNRPPTAHAQSLTTQEDTPVAVTLTGADPDGQALSFSVVSAPQNGTLTGVAPNLMYTPAPNFAGGDSFTFKANDGSADSAPAVVSITVSPINDLPVADAKTPPPFDEDTSIVIAFTGSDVEGSPLTFAVVTNPRHGTLSGAGDSRIYTPAPNYFGPDEFTYVAQDEGGASAPVSVTLTVRPVNDAPVANAITVSGTDAAPIGITLSGSDIEGDALTFVRLTDPATGVVTGTGAQLSYQAPTNFSGVVSFTYQASDGQANSEPATVTISVSNPNDPPVALPQTLQTPEDTPLVVVLTGTDRDGDTLTFQVVATPRHGTLSGTGATVTYKPHKDYFGPDSFAFKVNDGQFDSNVATIAIDVTPVDDAPVAQPQSRETAEDTPLAIVLAGSDAENQPLTYAIVDAPQHGTIAGTGANITYTPALNYHGTDTFTFKVNDGALDSAPATVTITITPQNDPPVALAQSAETAEDTPLTLTLTGADPENSALTFQVITPPQRGTYVLDGATVTYTPSADYHGADSFTFAVNDGELDSPQPATVSLTIAPRNDAPVAQDQAASLPENTTLQLTLGATDVDGDVLSFSYTAPQHGTLSGTAPNLTYTPHAHYAGPDSFTFKATDTSLAESNVATVSLTVINVNEPPTAAAQAFTLDEDQPLEFTLETADADGDALTYTIVTPAAHGVVQGWPGVAITTPPSLTYVPAADFNGNDQLTYRVTDGGSAPVEQTVTFTVRPVNDAPVANAQAPTTPEDTPLSITLTGTDAEGATLAFAVLTPPIRGTLSGTAPNLVYTPQAGVHGDDSFTFKVNDGALDSAPATVAITITPVNDAPVAASSTVEVPEDAPTNVALVATDADGDELSFTIVQPPEHGILTGTGANRVYTPALNYNGPDSFTFKASDPSLAESNIATVTILVGAIDDAPIVDAGATQTITLHSFATLAGTVTDVDGPVATVLWSLAAGPAAVEFEQASALQTRVAFTEAGSYTLRLTATSGSHVVSDEVTITVNASDRVFRTYTTSADFGLGANTNVNSAIPDQLQLNSDASAGHVLWVANSSKGTVVKINTRTGRVEGEYWTAPNGQPRNPSRTTVDLQGAVWCGNRDGNSIVHIGSVESGLWIDKNGNGQPDTSIGLNDIRGWTNAGGADTNGGVLTAADECIIHYVRVSSAGTRHLSVDRHNDIWVSGTGGSLARAFNQIDGETGAILRTTGPVGHGGYGGLIDRAGVIWSTTSGSLLRWDTTKPLSGPNGENWSTLSGSGHYGLALAPDGYVWASTLGPGVVYKYAPNGQLVGTFNQGNGNAQGLVVDRRGHVWIAHSLFNSTVGHLRPDGTWVGNVPVGSGPTGVAVDADGKIWATNHNDGTVSRIDPEAGPLGADGVTPRGAVDFTSPPLGGNLYNYSDMTGSNLVAPPITGVWTVVFDSNKPGTPWGSINWHALIVDDSKLSVTVASSADGVAYSPWRVGVRGQDLDVPNGRYLKINVLMQRSSTGHSPVLYDLTVGEEGYLPDYPFNQGPTIEAEPLQAATHGVDAKLQAKVLDDGLPHPSSLTFTWSKVSGPGTVTFDNANRVDATATFGQVGNYVLRLTASDGVETATKDVTVVANVPPTANAGPDLGTRNAGDTLALRGSVFDDAANLGGLVIGWRQLAGPAPVVFADATSPTSQATFPAIGGYLLELTANDGWAESKDTVEIRVGPPATAEIPRDPVAWWPFNLNYADVVGGRVAAPFGTSLENGYVGNGMILDGGGAYARVPGNANVDIGAAPAGLTVEFWAKHNVTGDQAFFVWHNGSDETVRAWHRFSGRRITVWLRGTDGQDRAMETGDILTVGQWHHYALTYNKVSGVGRLYVNGRMHVESNLGVFTPRTSSSYALWLAGHPSVRQFNGALDEFALYTRPITAAEVKAIYEAGAAGKPPYGNNAPPVIDAGPDFPLIAAATEFQLSATVQDDGLPDGTIYPAWSLVDGPAPVTFANAAALTTNVTLAAAGTYLFRLDADDGVLAAQPDFVEVRVGAATLETGDGIAAWWPGNAHPREIIRGGHDFELVNGAGYGAGRVSQGFAFPGNGGFARTPGHADLDIGTSPKGLTVEFWGKHEVTSDQAFFVWHSGNDESIRAWHRFSGRRLTVWLRGTDGQDRSMETGDILTVGAWHHYVITYDRTSGVGRIFVNGVMADERSLGLFTPRTMPNYTLWLGSHPSVRNFKGAIDEFMLYRRPLTLAEAKAAFEAGASGKSHPDDNAPPTVDAGPNAVIAGASGTVSLDGTVSDDGKPLGAPIIAWSVVDGPGPVTFGSPSAEDTSATFSTPGTYLLRLTASDQLTQPVSDLVEVRVGVGALEAPEAIAAWWPANGHPREVINGGHDFELGNGAGYAAGRVSQAFSFTGSGSFARTPGHADLDIGSSAAGLTVEFWAKHDVTSDQAFFVWHSGNDESLRAWHRFSGRRITVWFRGTDGQDRSLETGDILTVGQWHHYIVTYDRGTGVGRIHVNGITAAETTLGVFTTRTMPNYTLWLGSHPSVRNFRGAIDEFTLYRRPLKPAEAQAIFRAGVDGKSPPDDNLPPTVDAGPDVVVAGIGLPATLQGSVADDNKPLGAPTAQWSVLDGPGNVTFADASAATTTATFDAVGTYLLQLAGSDGLTASVKDIAEVRVAAETAEPAPGIAAWWPGNAHPREVINGNHDFEMGNGVAFGAGRVSQGFVFNGSGNYLRATGHPNLDIGSSAEGLTVEFWAKHDVTSDQAFFVWHSGNDESLRAWHRFSGRRITVWFRGTDGQDRSLETADILTVGQWHHYTITYHRPTGLGRIYVNGALATETNIGVFTTRTMANYTLWVGAHPSVRGFRGGIDELALYRRPLAPTEVQAIYRAGAFGKSPLDDNTPPIVNAGPDIALSDTSASATLSGSVLDDQKPLGAPAVEWSLAHGPGNVSFSSPTSLTTSATFSSPGTYLLRLTARDGLSAPVSDIAEVRVGVATVAAPSGARAWWPFNGHPREVINGNHDADLMNGVAYGNGQVAQGLVYNGGGNFARVAGHADLDIGASPAGLTIEFWAKHDTSSDQSFFGWHASGDETVRAWHRFSGRRVTVWLRGTDGQDRSMETPDVLTVGQWHHYAITYNRQTGNGRIYVNGTLRADVGLGVFTPRTNSNYTLWLGAHPSVRGFNGSLDEFTLYDRPLTPAEIASLATAGAAGKTPIVVNQPPIVIAGSDGSAHVGTPVTLTGLATDDGLPNPPASLTYQWTKVSGPGNVSFSAATALTTNVTFDAPGSYTLRLVANDSLLTGSDEVAFAVTNPPPVIALTSPANNATLAADTTFTLAANATPGVPGAMIAKVEFFRGATKLGEDTTAPFTWQVIGGLPAGSYAFTAKATDNSGAMATSATVNASFVVYSGPPVVKLIAPTDGARITQPVSLTGVIADPALASWTALYRLKAAEGAPEEAWITLATGSSFVGTPALGSNPEVPGELALFDPTQLLNGIYELELRMTDANGLTRFASAEPTTAVVEGNMKLGAFSLAFEDLKVPLAGIPITVTRTYDSRDTRVGDFGPGWRIALNNIRVQKNRHLGVEWWQTEPSGGLGFQFYYVEPQRERIVTITMPDGETHRFRGGAVVKNRAGDPDNASFAIPARQGTFRFYPMGDTTGTLEPLDSNNQLYNQIWLNGTGTQDLYAGEYGDVDTLEYNTTRFRLTTADGTALILDEKLGLLEMRDQNGNTLVLNRDGTQRVVGVTSTQNAPSGALVNAITIHRDATGRVDYIRDLAGRDIDYLYDAQGRLASVADREDNVTQFRYENASFPYYLTKVIDPRGIAAVRSEFDPATGKLIKQIDADGNETVFDRGVDATGRFEKVKDRLGHETTYYYDERGNVTLKVDPLGARTSYTYWPDSDDVKFEVDHYGNVTSKAYDARGNVTVETIGASVAENPANPTTGYTTRTTYNNHSAPLQITDADGRIQRFTYDSETGDPLTHTTGFGGPAPATTTYTYRSDGTPATVTDALGNLTSHTYQYGFNNPEYPAAVKQVTATVIDPAGEAGSDPLNANATVLRVTRTLFDSQENEVAKIIPRTLPDGSIGEVVTRMVYDSENRLRATIMPDGRVTETRYTSFGKPDKSLLWKTVADYTSGNEALARITTYGYDSRGNQTLLIDADGTTEAAHFDAEDRKVWSQDRRGYRTFFVHDPLGRLRFTIHPDANDGIGAAAPSDPGDARLNDNPRRETRYDLIGRVRFEIDERGATVEHVYEDNCGCAMRRKRTIQHLAAGNLVTHYEYDRAGNVRFVTDPRENTTETRYDEHGRATHVIHPATDEHSATQTETKYDLLGRIIGIVDQEQKVTRFRYDALGRLVEVRQYIDSALAAQDGGFALDSSQPNVAVTRYDYDELGSQTAQTDALGRVTRYENDSMGRRTRRILPKDAAEAAALSEFLRYDAWGNVWQQTDFAGRTTTFGYDELNRLRVKWADTGHPSLGYSHAIARIEYDYDANGARIAARTFNGNNLQLYSEGTPRDERGRIKFKDTAGGRLDYSYYANSLLKDTVSSHQGGVNVGYRYDELNRLAFVDDTSTGIPTRTSAYTYNANGSVASRTQANGVVHTYAYDALNRLRGLSVTRGATTLHSYEYKLRASGNRRQALEGAKTTAYTYDDLYRLTGETVSGDPRGNDGVVSYTLDKVGNRSVRASSMTQISSRSDTFNSRDWLEGDSYDANGNTIFGHLADLAARGNDVFDFENRLVVRLKADGSSVNVSYDADGNRIAKSILNAAALPVTSVNWLVDTNNLTGYAQILEERVASAAAVVSRVYTYGSELISQAVSHDAQAAMIRYHALDGHGSTRELTDPTGAVTDRYDYDAFGRLVFRSGATENAFLYCSEQLDADLGLYYLRARYLNTDSGRFWSMDSYQGTGDDPTSLHKYLYAHANPVMNMDPSGHMTLSEIQVAVGEAVSLGLRLARATINVVLRFRQAWCRITEKTVWQAHHLINLSFGGAGSRAGARGADLAAGITVKISKELHQFYHQLLNKTLRMIAGIPGNTSKAKVLQKLAAGELSPLQLKAAMLAATGIIDVGCFGVPGYVPLTPRLLRQFKEQGF